MVYMAKIVHSEAAPAEAVHYSFAGVEFDLGGKNKSYESSDPVLLSNAEAHPWLKVERDPREMVRGEYVEHLRPEDDALSAVNSVANDPDAVRAAQQERADVQPVAIDAGKPQTESVVKGGVAETLAADDSTKTSEKKDK